jgi:hypothetical protein
MRLAAERAARSREPPLSVYRTNTTVVVIATAAVATTPAVNRLIAIRRSDS